MDVNANFLTAEFVDSVKIHPKFIGHDMSQVILNNLRESKEGICSNHGYIKKNSIKLIKTGCGKVEMSSFHGYLTFLVKYSALVCNPVKGNIVNASVQNINNFGILCSSFIEDEYNVQIPILEIIVPKHSLCIQSDVDLQNNIKIHDEVSIQIVGKKYQLFNKKISIIGKIVQKSNVKLDMDLEVANTIDEDYDSDVIIDEEDDDEDEEEDNEVKDEEVEEEVEEVEEEEEDVDDILSDSDSDSDTDLE